MAQSEWAQAMALTNTVVNRRSQHEEMRNNLPTVGSSYETSEREPPVNTEEAGVSAITDLPPLVEDNYPVLEFDDFPQEENNFLDMSMNNDKGITNVLVAPEKLPTIETFVPGAEDNRQLLTFVRRAINNGQNLH